MGLGQLRGPSWLTDTRRNCPNQISMVAFLWSRTTGLKSMFFHERDKGGGSNRIRPGQRGKQKSIVFDTTQPAVRDGSRSSQNGRHENANERREDYVQR
jgi:hypothetical protein